MKASIRLLAFVLAALMIVSAMPVFAQAAGAYGFSDFPVGSWSEEAVKAAVDNGLISGKPGNIIAPRDYLTRAEAATVINRAFGATVKADISEYTDVKKGDWYYEQFQMAVNMGTITGEGNGILNPNGFITREAMFTVIARALVLSDPSASSLGRFRDANEISSWAGKYISELSKRGYVNGDGNGYLNPADYITREEFAQVMHNIIKVYICQSGEISAQTYGTTVIRVPGVTLSDVTIKGDLVLGDGVGKGDVTLNNITITGRLLCRGGEGTVEISGNSTVGENVVVHDVNGTVNFHNYRTEKLFEGIVLDTNATFLGSASFGGGSSSSSNAEYEIITYKEKLYKEGEYEKASSTTKKDNKGEDITYTPKDIKGFTLNAEKSELTGKNNGKLKIKVYYDRNEYTVTFDGNNYTLKYEQILSSNPQLKEAMEEAADVPGYNVTFTDANGADITGASKVEGSMQIFVNEEIIPYDIEYNLDGGNFEDGVTPLYSYTVESDDYVLPEPKKAGFTFLGWYDNAQLSGTPVLSVDNGSTGKKTFYAKWERIDAVLFFDHSISGSTVIVQAKLSAVPADVEDIAAMTLRYSFDSTKLEYVSTTSQFGDAAATAGNISWYSTDTSKYITNESLEAKDNVLFTITFNIIDNAHGKTTIAYTYAEIVASTPVGNPAVSGDYTMKSQEIDLGDSDGQYTVRIYNGYKKDSNLAGEYLISKGSTITQTQIEDALGDPEYYNKEEGYIDSDGNAHEISPELWLENGTEWELFDINMPIEKSIDICLLTRYFNFTYKTDLKIKGVSVPEVTVSVPYDSNSYIGQTALDTLTATRTSLERMLDQLDIQGISPYEILLNKGVNAGLIDSDGNIINPSVPVPLHKFISEGKIIEEIDRYIEDNKYNEEFIADVLRNDQVVELLLGDDDLRIQILQDPGLKDKLMTDEFLEDILGGEDIDDSEVEEYIDEVIEEYIEGGLDSAGRELVDKEIDEHMVELINDYISGDDRITLGNVIPQHEDEAIVAIKKTNGFKNTIKDFCSGNGVRVNRHNVVFVDIIANIMEDYDYDKLAQDFLPEQIIKFVDIIGRDVVEGYVEEYLDVFCADMNNAVDSVNADLDADITDSEYMFSTKPAVRINYMEILDTYYTRLSNKMVNKLESKADVLLLDQNHYLERLMDTNLLELLVETNAVKDDIHSGYALKDDILTYYDLWLEYVILVHDAITWYGTIDTLTVEQKLEAVSIIAGTYANKVNDRIMTYINTGKLPGGYTPQEIADKVLSKVLGINGKVDSAFSKVEDLYEANEDKILKLLEKAENFYSQHLDKDYTDFIDFANLSIYADGVDYPVYQIILEMGDNAFDADDLATAMFEAYNCHGVSKLESAMSKAYSKIKKCEYTPEASSNRYYRDAFRATVNSKTINGFSTGKHTFGLQRILRYFN